MTDIFGPQALTSDNGGYENNSFRQRVTIAGNISAQIRVTFTGSGAIGAFNADNISIGVWTTGNPGETTATPINLLVSGGAALSVAQGGTTVTDWLNTSSTALAGLTSGAQLVVVMDVAAANGNVRYATGLGSGIELTTITAANTYNVATGFGGTFNSGFLFVVSRIETQSVTTGIPKLIGGTLLNSPLLHGRLLR